MAKNVLKKLPKATTVKGDTMKFKKINVDLPEHDCDVLIRFPSGKVVAVQARPSNADVAANGRVYNGSLDFILPGNQLVTCWQGDDMEDAPAIDKNRQHERIAKQIVCELP
jgi:hypothetical protein